MAQVHAEPIQAQLLRGRVALYFVVGVLVALSDDASGWERAGAAAVVTLAAAYPLAATSRQQRLALAAAADMCAGFLVWLLVGDPVMSLLIVLWGLTITAFLETSEARRYLVGAAVAGEAVRIPLAMLGIGHEYLLAHTMAPGTSDLIVQGTARVVIVIAAYHFLRLIGGLYTRALNALRASAVEHSSLIEDAPTAVLVLDGWTVEYANAEACRLFGVVRLEQVIGADLRRMVGQDDVGRLARLLGQHHEGPVSADDVEVRPLDGPRRIVDAAITTVTFAGARRHQMALNDVTFRSEAQFALAESEELFRGAFANSPTPFAISDLTGTIVKVNDAFSALTGHAPDDAVGGSWGDLLAADDRHRAERVLDAARASGGLGATDTVGIRARSGREIPVRLNSSFIVDGEGRPVTVFTQLIDRSAQVAAEQQVDRRISQQQTVAQLGELALRNDVHRVMSEAAEALAQHLDSFVTGVFCAQPNGSLVLDAGIGWPDGAVSNYVIPPGSSEQMDYVMTHHAPFIVESLSREDRFTPSDFLTEKGAQAGVSAQIRGSRAPLGVVGVWSNRERSYSEDDVHFVEAVANLLAAAIERAQAQERLEELITSKDRFLASVSHELRTPLTVVNGMAAELQERWETFSTDEVVEFVRLIADQSRDMAALIEDLLVAARADIGAVTIKAVPVDLRRELETVVAALPELSLERNDVRHTPVMGDSSRLRQILRNLFTNAVRYGGPVVRAWSSFDGETVTLSIGDNGPGIPAEMRAKIFEPYQRAHQAAGVTGSVGLGLTVSRTLAELMHGSLTYRHVDGQSIFDLTLPAAASPALANVVSLADRRAIS